MNRYICNDLYDLEVLEALLSFKHHIKSVVTPVLDTRIINGIDSVTGIDYGDDNFYIRRWVIEYGNHACEIFPILCRNTERCFTHFYRNFLYNFCTFKGLNVVVPPRYYYSNGSRPRENGSYGWE